MGTACYLKGAKQLLDAVEHDLGIAPGETTADKKVSLLTARCLGSYGLAPAVVYDQEVAGKVGTSAMREHLEKWARHDSSETFVYAATAGLRVTASPRSFAFFWMLRISRSRYSSS